MGRAGGYVNCVRLKTRRHLRTQTHTNTHSYPETQTKETLSQIISFNENDMKLRLMGVCGKQGQMLPVHAVQQQERHQVHNLHMAGDDRLHASTV